MISDETAPLRFDEHRGSFYVFFALKKLKNF